MKHTDIRKLSSVVYAANGGLVAAENQIVNPIGITSAWWQVLSAIRYSPVPLPSASLARSMGLSRQAVQRIIDLLIERGLIEFKANPNKRRAKPVMLTVAGIDAVTRAEQSMSSIDRAIVERVGSERIGDAIRTLQEVNVVLSDWLRPA